MCEEKETVKQMAVIAKSQLDVNLRVRMTKEGVVRLEMEGATENLLRALGVLMFENSDFYSLMRGVSHATCCHEDKHGPMHNFEQPQKG